MELSVKKLQRAMENFIDKGDYQYCPGKYMFDYISDPDYVYMAIESHYIIRIPVEFAPHLLSVNDHPAIRTDINLERLITIVANDDKATEYKMEEMRVLIGDKPVVAFTNEAGDTILIDKRFFEQFYNKPITKYGVPDDITFTGLSGKYSYKSPLVMWQDDEAIAVFMPINPNV